MAKILFLSIWMTLLVFSILSNISALGKEENDDRGGRVDGDSGEDSSSRFFEWISKEESDSGHDPIESRLSMSRPRSWSLHRSPRRGQPHQGEARSRSDSFDNPALSLDALIEELRRRPVKHTRQTLSTRPAKKEEEKKKEPSTRITHVKPSHSVSIGDHSVKYSSTGNAERLLDSIMISYSEPVAKTPSPRRHQKKRQNITSSQPMAAIKEIEEDGEEGKKE